MFETSKLPTEQRTVTGNPVSFNTHYALPLDACKVSFSATQAGSGEPSPSNPRAISGVSAIGLTANSSPVSISLGEERFGGELDVLTGELTLTFNIVNLNSTLTASSIYNTNWRPNTNTKGIVFNRYLVPAKYFDRNTVSTMMCDKLPTQKYNDMMYGDIIGISPYTNEAGPSFGLFVRINDLTVQTVNDVINYFTNNPMQVVYELETPITIQLSANELSSIIGNNTFSTDTGTLEITFADLQEKSASGSVATFNTALAMPLSSCNIAVNAWQEGSGDPSPSNVRAIHGFSEVNVIRAGKNLLKKDNFIILYTPYSEMTFSKATFLKKGTYTISLSDVVNSTRWRYAFRLFDKNGNIFTNAITNGKVSFSLTLNDTYNDNTTCVSTSNIYGTSCVITIYEDCYITCSICFGNVSSATTCNPQIEAGSTATAYEPYVTPTIYTIQLGQDVYGAEVDVVNGVAHCTHRFTVFDGSNDEGWYDYSGVYRTTILDMKTGSYQEGLANYLTPYKSGTVPDASIYFGFNNHDIYVVKLQNVVTTITDLSTFKNYLSENPLQVVYLLAEPFDIQLTPTQIETIIGNNTIFADTGDVDITYKDCDLAKRGDFRQVFNIPD